MKKPEHTIMTVMKSRTKARNAFTKWAWKNYRLKNLEEEPFEKLYGLMLIFLDTYGLRIAMEADGDRACHVTVYLKSLQGEWQDIAKERCGGETYSNVLAKAARIAFDMCHQIERKRRSSMGEIMVATNVDRLMFQARKKVVGK